MEINELCEKSHAIAKEKGWYDQPLNTGRSISELISNCHAELSEAWEEFRTGNMNTYDDGTGKPCGFPIEIADTIIRLCDLCGYLGIDLEQEIKLKMEYNKLRTYRHGGKLA